jgi:hypothetical protein
VNGRMSMPSTHRKNMSEKLENFDMSVLREVKVGREKLFIHPSFVHLLTSDDHPTGHYGRVIDKRAR